jgi:AcrR family transcriptional regulator
MVDAAPGTRDRILQAAAGLFSSRGVGATSVRAIIHEAGVNLNAIHYHFGSKWAVAQQVLRRLMEPINRERHRLLDAAERGDAAPSVAALVHAVYWPVVRRGAQSHRSGAGQALLVFNQLRHDPAPEARAILADNQAEFAPRFEQLLERATGLREAQLRLTIRFINAAAWGVATQPALIDDVLRDEGGGQRIEALFDEFMHFAVAGIDRLKDRHSAAARRRRS